MTSYESYTTFVSNPDFLLENKSWRDIKLDKNEANFAMDIFEKEAAEILCEISGIDISNVSFNLIHREPLLESTDETAEQEGSFIPGFIFGIFVAKSILAMMGRAVKDRQ